MANKSGDISIEVIQKVDLFYSHSFERLSQFYDSSFDQLLFCVGVIGAIIIVIVGLVVPKIIFNYLQRRTKEVEKSIKIIEKNNKELIESVQKNYEDSLRMELKKFRADFESEKNILKDEVRKIEDDLKREIKKSEAKSFLFQSSHSANSDVALLLLSMAADRAIQCEEDAVIAVILDTISVRVKSLKIVPNDFVQETFNKIIQYFSEYNKNDIHLQARVSELAEEFKKLKNK